MRYVKPVLRVQNNEMINEHCKEGFGTSWGSCDGGGARWDM